MENRENNWVVLSGQIEEEPKLWSEAGNYRSYKMRIKIERPSGKLDFIWVHILDNLINDEIIKGMYVELAGHIRSREVTGYDGNINSKMYVQARRINVYTDKEELTVPLNEDLVSIQGLIATEPKLRRFNEKKVAYFKVEVMRPYGEYDYIHCLAWNSSAKYVMQAHRGDRIELTGRIQSRPYWYNNHDSKEVHEVSTRNFVIYNI